MRRLQLSGALIVFVFGLAAADDFKCPAFTKLTSDAYLFMDGEKCDVYWECINGQPNRHRCPDGLVFHPDKAKGEDPCDLKHNVPDKCKNRPGQQRPKPGDAHCPRQNGVYPSEDPSECDVFYSCLNGKGSPTRCAEGLHFSEHLGTCVWPRESGRDNCLSAQERHRKKQDSNPNPRVTTAKPQTLANGFTCPGGALGVHPALPHPTSCRQYYVCIDGITPTENGCGQGQVFNPTARKCDQPKNVPGCEDFYDEKAKAKKAEIADTVGTSVDSKEFSKFLTLLKMSGVLEDGGSARASPFDNPRPGRPGRRNGAPGGGRRKGGNGGRRRPQGNRRRPRPRPQPVYYDEYEYDYEDDNADIEDSPANDVENNIVEEQEDNEIQDSGFIDKRKKPTTAVEKSAPLTRFPISDRKSPFIDRFRPRLSPSGTTEGSIEPELSPIKEESVRSQPTLERKQPVKNQPKKEAELDLSGDEAAALFSSLLQDTLENNEETKEAIPMAPSIRTEPEENDISEVSTRPSFFPLRPGGRRPSPFNRRPAISANGNTEKDSELENDDEVLIENNDEEVSTESQIAFIPTPAIKTARTRPAFPRFAGGRRKPSKFAAATQTDDPKEVVEEDVDDSEGGRKSEILGLVPMVTSVEENDSSEEVAVTQSLIKMIPMVNKITTEPPQESGPRSNFPLRPRFNFGGNRNSNRPTFPLSRVDQEEETVDDETTGEESIDDNNGAPAIVFEQQELPRSLDSNNEERQSFVPRRRFPIKPFSSRRDPVETAPTTEEIGEEAINEEGKEVIENDSESASRETTVRRPLRTRTRLPTASRTSGPRESAGNRPVRRRGQIVRKPTDNIEEEVVTNEPEHQDEEAETVTEHIRSRERVAIRQRNRFPVSGNNNNADESEEEIATTLRSVAVTRQSFRQAAQQHIREPQPRRLLSRRPIARVEESATDIPAEIKIENTPEVIPVERLTPVTERIVLPSQRLNSVSEPSFDARARLPTATREREPLRQPVPTNRESVLPARVPVPANIESVLPARIPVSSRAQLPQINNLQEEPRAIARGQSFNRQQLDTIVESEDNSLPPLPFRRQPLRQPTSGGNDIFSNPDLLETATAGVNNRGATDIFSATGAVGLPFSTAVPQQPATPAAALTPAFTQLTPFQQLIPSNKPVPLPTPASITGNQQQQKQMNLLEQLIPSKSSSAATAATPALTPPPTQAPVNLPPISVPGQATPRIPGGFGNFQSFQIFQGPGQSTPINTFTGQPGLTGQQQGNSPFLSLQSSSQNSPAFASPQFNTGSTFSTFNFAAPQPQAANPQQTISPFQAALTKLPASALPAAPAPIGRQQLPASRPISLAPAASQISSNFAPINTVQSTSNVPSSQSFDTPVPVAQETAEQAVIRKMVTDRIRTHLKDLLAENEGDAVEKLREKVVASQNRNRARG